MIVNTPFHSKEPSTVVYHNNNKCTLGDNIGHKNLKSGTGGLKRLCTQCNRLNKDKK